MRAAIYSRFSTEKQRDASIEDQVRECLKLAQQQNLEVVATFEDRGISGGTAQRPGYQALLEAARNRQFELILTEDISRLWRSMAEYGPRAAELADIRVHTITCVGDDTRREGYGLILAVKQAMAEHARREISYRTRRGMEGLALAGKPTGGRCYGYTAAGELDPVQAPVVRSIFARARAGWSQERIAAQLNYDGTPTLGGGPWRQSTISSMLRNERYAGAIIWGRTLVQRSQSDSRRSERLERPGGPLVTRRGVAIL